MAIELIPWERAKVIAARTAIVSAIRGEETKVKLTVWCDLETGSSTIQPNPASPVEEFHAASVKIAIWLACLGFGSIVIKGFSWGESVWDIFHSLASERALCRVSIREKLRFWKTSWFLAIQIDQHIQAAIEPASIPAGGSEWIFLTASQPFLNEVMAFRLMGLDKGAISQTWLAKGQWNRRWATVSSSLHRTHRVKTYIFLFPNCSPTGRASCRDLQMKTLIFSIVLTFQTFASQSVAVAWLVGDSELSASDRVR